MRRAIRGELINTIQNRQLKFQLSPETSRLRTPIHFVFLLLLLFTLSGAIYTLLEWGAATIENWDAHTLSLIVKPVAFAFAFVTAAGLYITWMNRWFDKRAEAEFQARQFEIDINRASWAVEAALEWKGIQGEQMPEALLTGITKHLFEIHASDSAEYAPLEVLATSILGTAANIKMQLAGNEISLDRKSLKEISKSNG